MSSGIHHILLKRQKIKSHDADRISHLLALIGKVWNRMYPGSYQLRFMVNPCST